MKLEKFPRYLVCILATWLTACTATLELEEGDLEGTMGPLGLVSPQVFKITSLQDAREDRSRIGVRRNGLGQAMGDITTAEPVTTLVERVVVEAIRHNGHRISNEGTLIEGNVRQYWVDIDAGFWSIEIFGTVEVELLFSFPGSGGTTYSNVYRGSYREKRQGVLESHFNDIMIGALNDLVESIAFDEDLAQALMLAKTD